jgi:hypothetical protein
VSFDRDELVVAFEVDDCRERIDGTYAHPRFQELSDERARMVLFLMLDGVFGEDGVERWLGSIEVTRERLDNPLALLVDAQAELALKATGKRMIIGRSTTDDGEPSM